MTRYEQIIRTIHHCRDGLITLAEATASLDRMQVRGGFDGIDYTGFDYRDQCWITYP